MHIITEINGPGHARAAIKAMEKRGEEQFILYDKPRFQINMGHIILHSIGQLKELF